MREALKQLSGSLEKLAEKTVSICSAYRKLAEEIPDTPTQLSESKVFPGTSATFMPKLQRLRTYSCHSQISEAVKALTLQKV